MTETIDRPFTTTVDPAAVAAAPPAADAKAEKLQLRVTIGVPSSGTVKAAFCHSLAGLIAYAAGGIRSRPDAQISLELQTLEGSVIHANREALVNQAIKGGSTHVLFLDDDMSFAPSIVDVLFGRKLPIVAVNYLMKKFPGEFVAVRLDEKGRLPTLPESSGLEEASYTGFGAALIETRVFKAVPKPWFLPLYVPELDTYTTEDNPFYARARHAGFPCMIDHDASKLVLHIGNFPYRWDQYVEPRQRVQGDVIPWTRHATVPPTFLQEPIAPDAVLCAGCGTGHSPPIGCPCPNLKE